MSMSECLESLALDPPQRRYQTNSEAPCKLVRPKHSTGKETILFLKHAVLQQFYVRTKIANALIKVKGIISVTYDLNKNFCIIRGKRHISSEIFAVAVANLGYEVSWVCKNERKEEIFLPISADIKNTSDMKENMAEYLPEEDNEPSIGENAVRKKNSPGKTNENDGSLLGSAMKFVRNSFYW